ncbi:dephospho-CoA kinase [Telmatobacter sp. DSM 110680]|uniref:Dephospho-CoA kinase n=1 Tax=Telmatobacter sp. DSM 110680 TaxID=3036704 RepID=A0AAU7DM10_9BACT
MLRVGLTGGLGSGKSTVAHMLHELGAEVIESDELGRALMEPGQEAFTAIVRAFGQEVLMPDGRLNRARLAEMAFKGGRVKELNAIIHPAVIEAQRRWMEQVFARDPAAVAVVVSALIFEVERDARESGEANGVFTELRKRIDRVVLVIAPDDAKIARYVDRTIPAGTNRDNAEADARSRLAHQIPDSEKAPRADYLLENTGDIDALRTQVRELWPRLKQESNLNVNPRSLK